MTTTLRIGAGLTLLAGLVAWAVVPSGHGSVASVTVAPDTMALYYLDQGLLTATARNSAGAVLVNAPITWRVRDTLLVKPITTKSQTAAAVAKAAGTTWVVARASSGTSDSAKVVVLTSSPTPIPPTPPSSTFVVLNHDTLHIDSGSAGTVTASTYRDAAHTSSVTGRTVSSTSTSTATATVMPIGGASPITFTATGVTPGTAKLIAAGPTPTVPDTTVVVVASVVGPPTPPDTTPTPVVCAPGGYTRLVSVSTATQLTNALAAALPGDCIRAAAGTYATGLTLSVSGTAAHPILVQCVTVRTCTISSGSSRTVGTSGRVHYYTLDGFRFISTSSAGVESAPTIDLSIGTGSSTTDETVGNNHFILKNCYVEGSVKMKGRGNVVDTCEFNGRNVINDAIWLRDMQSQTDTIRNSLIYGYTTRGVWTMQQTDSTVVSGTTIHNISNYGINCDGAGVPVNHCKLTGDTIYNVTGGGIFFENCFNCLAQGNVLHDIVGGSGFGIFVENYGNGGVYEPWHTAGNIEYRDDLVNTSILNNVVYTYGGTGVFIFAASGLTVDHNTFYELTGRPPISFKNEHDDLGNNWNPTSETITNNIFRTGVLTWYGTSTNTGNTITGNFSGAPSPGFVNAPTDLHLLPGSNACGKGAYPC